MNEKNLIPAKKGEVRNPKGRNQWSEKNELLEDLSKRYGVSKSKFKQVFDKMIVSLAMMNKEELQEILRDPRITLIERNAIQSYTGEDGHEMLMNDLKLIFGKFTISESKEDNGIIIKFVD